MAGWGVYYLVFCVVLFCSVLFCFSGLGMFWNGRSEEGQYKVKDLHTDHLKKFTTMESKGVSHVTRSTVM